MNRVPSLKRPNCFQAKFAFSNYCWLSRDVRNSNANRVNMDCNAFFLLGYYAKANDPKGVDIEP